MSDWIDKARDAMKRRGMTNLQLARELGVSQTTVGRWLSGRHAPGARVLQHIGRILGVRLDSAGAADSGDAQEVELLAAFRRMLPAERMLLLQCLRDREHRYHGRPEDLDR
jgi:transcriptional regulator with XRE-family HTH domain